VDVPQVPSARLIPGLGRRPDQPVRTTFLELFFDLVYIFAFTQLSSYLLGHLDWVGAGRTLLLLLPLWWVWTLTAWQTDVVDPSQAVVQGPVVGVMVGILVMSVYVPHAYGAAGVVFASVYVAVQTGTNVYYLLLGRTRQVRGPNSRALVWFALSAVPWIIGGLSRGLTQGLLWALAAAVDYASAVARWPIPWLGRLSTAELRLAGEHVAERYRQFFIIALGETILTTGSAYSHSEHSVARLTALVASFAITGLIGRIYIYRAGQLLETAIAEAPEPWRPGSAAAQVHLIMIAGVVTTAAADEILITHPLGHTRPSWVAAVLGGPSLFLAGRALLDRTVFGRVSRTRAAGLLVLAALSPVMLFVPMLAVGAVTVLVLLGIAVANAASWRRLPVPVTTRVRG
jgi:low temperature requirement protein LtrA